MIHMTVGQDVTTTRDLVGMIVVIAEDTLDLHLVMVVGEIIVTIQTTVLMTLEIHIIEGITGESNNGGIVMTTGRKNQVRLNTLRA